MNLGKLFMMQSELDARIENEHPRAKGESRHHEKILALLVELGELANETRCFKFWSYRLPSVDEVVLEEYVDGVHFLVSIGLENDIKEFGIGSIKKDTLTEQFICLYNSFSLLYISFTPKTYSEAWSAYVGLADMLGFNWKAVEAAYIKKNRTNHRRQEESY